jgi:hypothetical protein
MTIPPFYNMMEMRRICGGEFFLRRATCAKLNSVNVGGQLVPQFSFAVHSELVFFHCFYTISNVIYHSIDIWNRLNRF